MTTEPFRYDQQVIDVSDMNITSGLRNSLNPLSSQLRLRLSSDLLSSNDILGRSADGTSGLSGGDGPFGSSPMLMAAHQKAMNNSQLSAPLSSTFFASGGPGMSSTGVSAVLSNFSNSMARDSPLSTGVVDGNTGNAARDPYMGIGGRATISAPMPVIQVPAAGLQTSGPTLREAMASNMDTAAIQQAALQQQSNASPFSMEQYLQHQQAVAAAQMVHHQQQQGQGAQPTQQANATTNGSAMGANVANNIIGGGGANNATAGVTPLSALPPGASISSSGTLRFSGDRFAQSAFSPVSPGGSASSQKLGTIQFTPNTTPGSQILSPLSLHIASSVAGLSSSPISTIVGSSSVSSPFSPSSSSFSMHPQMDAMNRSSLDASSALGAPGQHFSPAPSLASGINSSLSSTTTGSANASVLGSGLASGMSHPSSPSPFGLGPPQKRSFLGSPMNDAPHLSSLPPGYRNVNGILVGPGSDAVSNDETSRTTAGFNPDDHRTTVLLQSIYAMNQGVGLAANAVKQENMIQEHMLGHGVLAGPASAAFTYQGKAIPYSEEAARQHYMMLEESKKADLVHIQTQLKKRSEANGGSDENFLSDTHLEHRKVKKLHPLTYDALYRSLVANVDGAREEYLLNEHPQVTNLNELPGRVYFLQVPKGSRKPPHVGFPFRSYSDSHYTSVDRETPVICKVKEWPVDNDPKNIWRLYHYYLGNKKRAPRKRKRAGDSLSDGE